MMRKLAILYRDKVTAK